MRTLCTALLLCLSLLPAARAKGRPAGQDLVGTARVLAERIGMPLERRDLAIARLEKALASGKLHKRTGGKPISAVFAYQMGEGGFLVKVKRGKGLVRFLQSGKEAPIVIKSVTFGAQIGGSSEWGIGLVLGLGQDIYFGGEYSGNTRGATAWEASTNITQMRRSGVSAGELAHEIYLIGAAAGLSANAGGAKMTIEVRK